MAIGLVLIVLELTLVRLAFFFDLDYGLVLLLVFWALGWCYPLVPWIGVMAVGFYPLCLGFARLKRGRGGWLGLL